MLKNYLLCDIINVNLDIKPWNIIFLNWDLAAWKTTLTKHILNNLFNINKEITSPTYTYYNKYDFLNNWKKINIYHFDLYRLNNYEEFIHIWWEEILDDENNISIIEWPDIIKNYYNPNIDVYLSKTSNKNERSIKIKYN